MPIAVPLLWVCRPSLRRCCKPTSKIRRSRPMTSRQPYGAAVNKYPAVDHSLGHLIYNVELPRGTCPFVVAGGLVTCIGAERQVQGQEVVPMTATE